MTLQTFRCKNAYRQHKYLDESGAFCHKCLRCGNQHFDYTADGQWRYPPRTRVAGTSSRAKVAGPDVGVTFQVVVNGEWSRPFRVDSFTGKLIRFSMPSFDTEPATRRMSIETWRKELGDFTIRIINR